MFFKPITASILLFLALGMPLYAQLDKNFYKEIEVVGGMGTANYFGDIGGKDNNINGVQAVFDNLDIDLWQTRTMFTIGGRVNPYKYLGISLQLSPIFLSGSDLRSNYASRGYSFKTSIIEASLQAEYYFANRITGYAPFGIGGVSGMLYSVVPGDTGIRTKWYGGNTLIFGAGMRFPSGSRLTHSVDFTFHFSTTDNLDFYKTPRNSKDLFFVISYKANLLLYTTWYYDHKGLVR